MKSYSEFLTEAFDMVPQSKKEIDTMGKGIFGRTTANLIKKLFTDLATKDVPDPINIERLWNSQSMSGSNLYDGYIKIHPAVWPAALTWAKKNKADIRKREFIVGHNPKKKPSGLKVGQGRGTRTAPGKGAKGTSPSGAQWENLITIAYNSYKNGKQIKQPASDEAYATVANHWTGNSAMAIKLSNHFHSAVSGEMTQFGKGNGTLSAYWTGFGASNGTPKTDMYTGKGTDRISLKKAGGSQGMSPTKEETMAVLSSALDIVGAQEEGLMKEIIGRIETDFKQIILDGSKSDFDKKVGVFAQMKSAEYNSKQAEILDLEGKHEEIQKLIEELANKDPAFYTAITQYITFEACTGHKKFAETLPKANIMIEFDPSKGKVNTYKMGTPGRLSSDIKKIASGVKFQVSFKTGSSNPSSSLRASFTKKGDAASAGTHYESYEEYSHIPTFKELVYETLAEDEISGKLLTEDYEQLDEFAMLDKAWKSVKKLSGGAKRAANWLKRVLYALLDKVTQTFAKIKEMGERAWGAMMGFLAMEIDKARIKTPAQFNGFMWKGN